MLPVGLVLTKVHSPLCGRKCSGVTVPRPTPCCHSGLGFPMRGPSCLQAACHDYSRGLVCGRRREGPGLLAGPAPGKGDPLTCSDHTHGWGAWGWGSPPSAWSSPSLKGWGAILRPTGPCAPGQCRSAEGSVGTLGAPVQLLNLGDPDGELRRPRPEPHDPRWGDKGTLTSRGPGVNQSHAPAACRCHPGSQSRQEPSCF